MGTRVRVRRLRTTERLSQQGLASLCTRQGIGRTNTGSTKIGSTMKEWRDSLLVDDSPEPPASHLFGQQTVMFKHGGCHDTTTGDSVPHSLATESSFLLFSSHAYPSRPFGHLVGLHFPPAVAEGSQGESWMSTCF